jgi:predicted secreted protein
MKKLLVVSHCILNTAAKVAMDEKELAAEYAVKDRLMQSVQEQHIQLLQLPCPEFLLYGSRRWGHVKNQFMHPHYRKECRRMLEPVLLQLEEYLSYPEDYFVLGIVSVEGSPSCGFKMTCVGQWGGELPDRVDDYAAVYDTFRTADGSGVFMEILQEELQRRHLQIPIITMEEAIEKLC